MKKVLVIEDDTDLRLLIKKILEIIDLQIIEAKSGSLGLQLAKQHQPDLIISDIDMPEISGYDVLKQIKEDTVTARIPFIFLTGRVDDDSHNHALQLGATFYMTKPFRIDDLLITVAHYINLQPILK